MFAGFSATIIATRRRPVLILHLEEKYAKIDCKNEIYAKNWVRSTWTTKVNSSKKSTLSQSQRKSTVWSTSWPTMMSADWLVTSADDVAVMTSPRVDVSRWTPSACRRVGKSNGMCRSVTARELLHRIFWRRVESSMMVRFPREGRSAEDNLSGTCKNTIGATITVAIVWQWSRDFEWRRLQVRNQRRWLKRVKGLTTNGCSNSCKGGSNCEFEIIPIKTGLPRKS